MTRMRLLCQKERGAEETERELEKLGLRGGRNAEVSVRVGDYIRVRVEFRVSVQHVCPVLAQNP